MEKKKTPKVGVFVQCYTKQKNST